MTSIAPRPAALRPAAFKAFAALAIVGAAAAALGLVMAPERMWAGWLLASYFVTGLALAGLLFVAIHYASGATWGVAIRRVPEALASTLPFCLALLAILFLAHPQLYPWAAGGIPDTEPLLAFKRWWLQRPTFLVRFVLFAALWLGFARSILTRSRRQDHDGNPRWTLENRHLSAAFLVVFGITFSLASVDWVMSLEPAWYSTIFAAYNFAGLFTAGLAVCILVAIWLERAGPLDHVLSDAHLHDLGKLLFAFSTFWAYLWFSQYMLIWYTDIPEETAYFARRAHGGWWPLFLLNIVLNWVVPFLALIRRDAKRQRQAIATVAIVVLVGHWLDLYLMIGPPLVGEASAFPVWELGITAGAIGAIGLMLARSLGSAPAVPVADPDLHDSLAYD
jgi:hypothetical protein